jgi:hypothetical protein
MSTVLDLTLQKVSAMGMNEEVLQYATWHSDHQYFVKGPGVEHYCLLAQLGSVLPPGSKAACISTKKGYNALALASHATDLDIHCYGSSEIPDDELTANNLDNVTLHEEDWRSQVSSIASMQLVVVDIEPHEGVEEAAIALELFKAGFKGILVLDDIYLNPGMHAVWAASLPSSLLRLDATPIGHWTGTGLVLYSPDAYELAPSSAVLKVQ